jgi:hypothetical protein
MPLTELRDWVELLLGAAIGAAGLYFAFFRKTRTIVWCALRPASMMAVASDLTDQVSIQFKDSPIRDLTKFAFIIHNAGRESLKKDEIVSPLTWEAPGTILEAKIKQSDPTVSLRAEVDGDQNSVAISWDLFNPGNKALLEVLVTAPYSVGDEEKVRAEIDGISRINLHWTAAGKLSRLTRGEDIKGRWEKKSPFHYRFGPPVVVYSTIAAALFAWQWVHSVGLTQGWAFASGAVVFVALSSILILFYPRGPYDRWLRSR